MYMKIKTIKVKVIREREFTLSEQEMKTVRHCLDYAYHRLVFHRNSGISKIVNLNSVNNIRAQF